MVCRIAFVTVVVLFAGIVLYLDFTEESKEPVDEQLLIMLSIVHGVVAAVSWIAFRFIPNALLRPIARGSLDDEARWEQGLSRLRVVEFVRLIALDVPALLGLVVCLLGVLGGLMATQPLFWLNGLSALVIVLYVRLTSPTEERIESVLERALRAE
jgi:hypothetical protein